MLSIRRRRRYAALLPPLEMPCYSAIDAAAASDMPCFEDEMPRFRRCCRRARACERHFAAATFTPSSSRC